MFFQLTWLVFCKSSEVHTYYIYIHSQSNSSCANGCCVCVRVVSGAGLHLVGAVQGLIVLPEVAPPHAEVVRGTTGQHTSGAQQVIAERLQCLATQSRTQRQVRLQMFVTTSLSPTPLLVPHPPSLHPTYFALRLDCIQERQLSCAKSHPKPLPNLNGSALP